MAAMLLGALLDVATLGAVLPFLSVLSNPDRAWEYLAAVNLQHAFGMQRGDDIRGLMALGFIIIAVSAGAVRLMLAWIMNRFAFAVARHLSGELFGKLIYQDYAFHIRHNSSTLITNVHELQQLTNGVLIPLIQATSSVVIGLCIVSALIYINPVVAGVALFGFGGCYVIISLVLRKKLRENGAVLALMNAEKIRAVQESLGGIREVLLDNTQPFFLETFRNVDRKAANALSMVTFSSTAPRYILESLGMVLIALISLYFNSQPGGLMSALPTLAALALGALRLLPLMQQGYSAVIQLTGNWRRLSNLLDLLEMATPRRELQAAPSPAFTFERELLLDDVTFRYMADMPPVLAGVSLRIPKGSRVGIVGTTGSGKSTITDLIMGLLAPSGGAIKVDGVALTPGNMRAWHEQIAHVPQSIFLADSSIERNIAFGCPDDEIDKERVRDAARQAQVSAFVESLPDGYDTRVGERGVWLSGGQRQRIGIARALYKNASVLILDEATSALDNATEAAIIESLEQLDQSLTIIIVAHRLTTIESCDTLVQLEGGRITFIDRQHAKLPAGAKASRTA
ncbi:ATP-binding cassette domain-containing protein [Phenylobacterium sp. LH3H17]|uniref:ABC transporter ATP-binding protein n=1 Tax=Phenylobacterium sp. LH3H17 TaxID=2903901 RepID=UPI0020C9E910|nr:ATP-binding cassette domain-containing protein [Phenylobacterium sp. LH3H17]UTP40974.1 ATP-binding cassette domain-containing protein [Phenylobacterium sp. LH3H17]